jgi:conjugal transfer mating pair stabilization protein TraN
MKVGQMAAKMSIKKLIVIMAMLLFSTNAFAGRCHFGAPVCVDGPSTKLISGVKVTRDCWRYQTDYSCATDSFIDDCDALKNKGCAQIGSTCIVRHTDGECDVFEQKYRCEVKPAESSVVDNCASRTFCINEHGEQHCFDAGSAADPDFGIAVATLESLRQLGTYMSPDNTDIFRGEDNRCSKKLGISNCCKPSNGGSSMTNQMLAMQAGLSVAGNAMDAGSGYVYDALMSSGSGSLAKGMKSIVNGLGGDFSFKPSLSYMGVGVSYGMPATGTTALWSTGGEVAVNAVNAANAVTATAESAITASAATSGQAVVYFEPTAFYVAVAFMVYQELTQCDKDEQALSVKIGQKLCHSVGSYCAQKVLFGCLVIKETHCCFNSKLARIINEQGRVQLGRDWGAAESPQCTGLTMTDIQKIDFSRIDLSEFIQDIIPKAIDVNAATDKASASVKNLTEKYQSVTTGTSNYYEQ